MTPFLIRAEISTPISLTKVLHLDSLIENVWFNHHPGARGPAKVPISQKEGIYLASASWLETGYFGAVLEHVVRTKRLSTMNMSAPPFTPDPKEGRKGYTISSMSKYRNQMTNYPIYTAVQAVWWAAVGIPDECLAMARTVSNLGAMANTGYGSVIEWEVMEVSSRNPNFSWLTESGMPCRNLPFERWRQLSGTTEPPEGAIIYEGRTKPPYWVKETEACIGPAQFAMIGQKQHIRTAFGCEIEDRF